MSALFIIFAIISMCIISSDAFSIDKDLVFRLYTHRNPTEFYSLSPSSISTSPFDPKLPTRIFTHGFQGKEKVIDRYREAFLSLGQFNFIAVDWIKGANTFNYISAKGRVRPISEKLSQLIDALVANGMQLKDVTLIGHSLGAHISGRAAKQLKSQGKIARIIGLDPASILFDYKAVEKRIAISDADYVQIIHTDSEKLGFEKPLGHADFYPNRGSSQPGCPKFRNEPKIFGVAVMNGIGDFVKDRMKCSHNRAHQYFLESLQTKFQGIHCASEKEIKKGVCTFNNVTGIMGGDATQSTSISYGIFYVETKSESPFNIPDYKDFKNIKIITNALS